MKVCIFVIFYILSSMISVLAKENQLDNIVAIVNNEIILNSDVNKVLFLLKKQGKDFKIPLKSNFLKEQVIQKLIIDSLILQEASKMNIIITKEQINAVLENIAFEKKISIEDLKKNIFHESNGQAFYNNYIKTIEKSLKIKTVQDYELHKRINISEQEVNFLFKQIIKKNKKLQKIKLSYILLPFLQDHSDNDIKKRRILVEKMVNKLKKGYDFQRLYTDYKKNKDTIFIKKMFWMRLLDIKNNFSSTLKIFKKGQILGPFLKDKGFYILQINDINNHRENIKTEFYLQHCLIKPSVILNDLESKKMIFDIYEKIKKGIYSFDYAVKNFSHDFYSSNKKGNLGWMSTELFNHDVNKELLCLNKNEISRPIKSSFGWHIVKLLDKRQVDTFYNIKKKQAYKILLEKKMIEAKNNWIEELKNIAYIKIIRS